MSNSSPDERPACGQLSPAARMRLRLAQSSLHEMRDMDLGAAHPATLILAIERLGNALEDAISMVLEAHPEDGSTS